MDALFQALTHPHDGGQLVAGVALLVLMLALSWQSACDRLVAIIRACLQRCGCDTCARHRHPKKRRRRSR